jgi:acetyltransferase-like isoleucine patch superfamily enzyme
VTKNIKLKSHKSEEHLDDFLSFHNEIDGAMREQHNRSLPFNEEFTDRWDRAKKLGFGEGTSIYDNSYVYGEPKVGSKCWIGPITVIDGSGDLEIGDGCTISAGAQVYSHDNVLQTISKGAVPIERAKTTIGNHVYIGPNAVITKGSNIGNHCVVGAFTMIKGNIPDNSVVVGTPGRIIGIVSFDDGKPIIKYLK